MATNGNKTILLVTGDAERAEALGGLLTERGYAVSITRNGAEGLLAAHAERPSLVVTDAELPVLDGYRMIEVLRDDPATHAVTVVLLTPGDAETELARGWLCGADFCLSHQSALPDLLLMIERLLCLDSPAQVSLAS